LGFGLGHAYLILEDKFMDDGKLQEEFGVDAPFVGRRHDKPTQSFRVGRDVFTCYFVVLDCMGPNYYEHKTCGTFDLHINLVLEAHGCI
jgi:hypothetical protein